MKVMSVAMTVAGVSLISVFEREDPTPSNHTLSSVFMEEETVAPTKTVERNTPLGYVVSESRVAIAMHCSAVCGSERSLLCHAGSWV